MRHLATCTLCVCVCARLRVMHPPTQVDRLFESLDEDKGGSLDANEVKLAFKKLRDAAADAMKEQSHVRELAELYRTRGQQTTEV